MRAESLRQPATAPASPAAQRSEPAPSGYRLAAFLGAGLLFQVQLISARALLPRFGGSPAVWTTCMLFYQALLLAGYAYAHGVSRLLRPRAQAGLSLALLGLSLAFLPLAPRGVPGGSAAPVLEILALLARTVALPAFLLSATSPLLQSWAALGRGQDAAPYRLYAWSNAGSLLGLFGYPLAVEPLLSRGAQEVAWSGAFVAYVLLAAWCARRAWSAPPPAPGPHALEPAGRALPLGPRRWLVWLALSACSSTLLLAATNQMCQEVAVVPLLWVLPLGLYLASYLLCFSGERWYARAWCLPVLVLALAAMAQATALGARAGIRYAVPVYSLGLFVCCLFCHGELAARRPAARHLTAFYLTLALGGALGGVFVSLAAPLLFRGYDELYVALLACGALAAGFVLADPSRGRSRSGGWNPLVPALVLVVLLISLALGTRVLTRTRPGLTELRSFHGALRVQDLALPGGGTVRSLTHGRTFHGQQFRAPERRAEPTAYFGRESGIGVVLAELMPAGPLRVGIIGLGAGVLAAYGRAGDTYRFYELDPLVIEIARREFTFLGDSPAAIEVVPGDARLALEREEEQRFDVLVLDAFSSDAIPVHLLTREAFALYGRHLAPRGVLALHVTTRHLDLGPLIEVLAREAGRASWEIRSAADDARGLLDARWVLLATDAESLARPRIRAAGQALARGSVRPWTDDYSNLLAVLR